MLTLKFSVCRVWVFMVMIRLCISKENENRYIWVNEKIEKTVNFGSFYLVLNWGTQINLFLFLFSTISLENNYTK